jgi:hypothetical protein
MHQQPLTDLPRSMTPLPESAADAPPAVSFVCRMCARVERLVAEIRRAVEQARRTAMRRPSSEDRESWVMDPQRLNADTSSSVRSSPNRAVHIAAEKPGPVAVGARRSARGEIGSLITAFLVWGASTFLPV